MVHPTAKLSYRTACWKYAPRNTRGKDQVVKDVTLAFTTGGQPNVGQLARVAVRFRNHAQLGTRQERVGGARVPQDFCAQGLDVGVL